MKKMLLIVPILILLALGACGYNDPAYYATPTVVNPGEVALTMISQKVNAEATQMAVNVQFTATAQVVGRTVTAQARADGLATAEQGRKDAQATAAKEQAYAVATEQQRRQDAAATQARLDAVSTAEQQERNVIGTATAQMASTYAAATVQAWPLHDQWTQQAVEVEQALATNEVALSDLEVEQQRERNTPEWVIPLLGFVAAIGAGVFYLVRHTRVREIKNEETGVVEGLVLDNKTVIRPQLMPGAVLTNLNSNQPIVPLLTDAKTQGEIVARNQGIEALRVMPTQTPTPAATGCVATGFCAATPRRCWVGC